MPDREKVMKRLNSVQYFAENPQRALNMLRARYVYVWIIVIVYQRSLMQAGDHACVLESFTAEVRWF